MSITRERICRKPWGIVLADRTPAVRTSALSLISEGHPPPWRGTTHFFHKVLRVPELFITVKNADSRDALFDASLVVLLLCCSALATAASSATNIQTPAYDATSPCFRDGQAPSPNPQHDATLDPSTFLRSRSS
jgi:hypothetical protein